MLRGGLGAHAAYAPAAEPRGQAPWRRHRPSLHPPRTLCFFMSYWVAVFDELVEEQFVQTRIRGLLDGRCFWGRGLRPPSQRCRCCRNEDLHPALSSWLEDYFYYVQNNHPMLSIFFHDQPPTLHRTRMAHVLRTWERIFIEFVTLSISCLLGAVFSPAFKKESGAWPYILIFVYVTIPSVVLHTMLVYIYTCKCCLTEYEERETCCRTLTQRCGIVAATFVMTMVALASLVVGIETHVNNTGKPPWKLLFYGRGIAYATHPLSAALIQFNPSEWALAAAQANNCCGAYFCCVANLCHKLYIPNLAAIGKWRLQREKVKEALLTTFQASGTASDVSEGAVAVEMVDQAAEETSDLAVPGVDTAGVDTGDI